MGLILLAAPIPLADIISSAFYAVMYSITISTGTVYFLNRKRQKEERRAASQPGSVPAEGFWSQLRRTFAWRGSVPTAPAPSLTPSGS